MASRFDLEYIYWTGGVDIVPAPVLFNDVLHVTQPLSALPLWELILTKLPAGDYAIVYGVSRAKSWAFLRPNKANLRHKIGV